jgi:hypothetical protein
VDSKGYDIPRQVQTLKAAAVMTCTKLREVLIRMICKARSTSSLDKYEEVCVDPVPESQGPPELRPNSTVEAKVVPEIGIELERRLLPSSGGGGRGERMRTAPGGGARGAFMQLVLLNTLVAPVALDSIPAPDPGFVFTRILIVSPSCTENIEFFGFPCFLNNSLQRVLKDIRKLDVANTFFRAEKKENLYIISILYSMNSRHSTKWEKKKQ